jgi:hypothetical protein
MAFRRGNELVQGRKGETINGKSRGSERRMLVPGNEFEPGAGIELAPEQNPSNIVVND